MKTQSKTASGVPVTITPKGHTYCGRPTPELWLEFVHPEAGRTLVVAKHYGSAGAGSTAEGAVGHGYAGVTGEFQTPAFRSKKTLRSACITIPRADFDAAMAVARAEADAAVDAEKAADRARAEAAALGCPAGFVVCTRKWSNGDLCAACYVTADGVEVIASDLLESHGGFYWLPASAVEDARGKLRAEAERGRAASAKADATLEAAKAEARATGKPVEFRRWTEDCDGSADECSTDLLVSRAHPDGTVATSRTRTH